MVANIRVNTSVAREEMRGILNAFVIVGSGQFINFWARLTLVTLNLYPSATCATMHCSSASALCDVAYVSSMIVWLVYATQASHLVYCAGRILLLVHREKLVDIII
jgi:hypothetical protein